MIEVLFACAILMDVEIMPISEYNKQLDQLFMEDPADELLIQLEYCSSDIKESILTIYGYVKTSWIVLNQEVLGKFLFEKMDEMYKSEQFGIKEFSAIITQAWFLLPQEIRYTEPFDILYSAYVSLSLGEVKQAEQWYEEAFAYYK